MVSYEYDSWGVMLGISGSMAGTLGQDNPYRYKGYYYDTETMLYYLGSRYYNPGIGRFVNADDVALLGASPEALTDKNLYAYCDNNPVVRKDTKGDLWTLAAGIVAASGAVGALMGAFSAAATGGNVLEGAIEGAVNGAIGAAFGLAGSWVGSWAAVAGATVLSIAVDAATQAASYYIDNKTTDGFQWDWKRSIKTGAMTGLGVMVPGFRKETANIVNAVGTTLVWAETTVVMTSADVIVTNAVNSVESRSSSTSGNSRGSAGRNLPVRENIRIKRRIPASKRYLYRPVAV